MSWFLLACVKVLKACLNALLGAGGWLLKWILLIVFLLLSFWWLGGTHVGFVWDIVIYVVVVGPGLVWVLRRWEWWL